MSRVHRLRLWLRRHPTLRRALRPILQKVLVPALDLVGYDLGGYRRRYTQWIRAEESLGVADRDAIVTHITALGAEPLISEVMPVYNTPEAYLREAIASLQAQIWPHWELCIADDASPAPHVARVLAEVAAEDHRIRVIRREVNGHISAASNTALTLATGAWVALMDHDDLLSPTALYEAAAAIARHPAAQVIYSDEDKIDHRGRRSGPYFKPDFDPELLFAQNLISHFGLYRRDLPLRIGGFREGFEGSQDHDLALRATQACGPASVRHIPAILYHWRQQAGEASFSESAQQRCIQASAQAVAEALAAEGAAGCVVERAPRAPVFHRIRYRLPDRPPMVSIIMTGAPVAIADCLVALLAPAPYPELEWLLPEAAVAALPPDLRADPRLRLLTGSAGDWRDHAGDAASGVVLIFLDAGIAAGEPGWLEELVAQACRPRIGAVGARILDAQGRLLHGGLVLGLTPHGDQASPGLPSIAGSPGFGLDAADPGPFGVLALTRSVSAVSDACLAIRRSEFLAAGGFAAHAGAGGFADVDLCLRLRERGLSVIWSAAAELRSRDHVPAPARASSIKPPDPTTLRSIAWMQALWGRMLLEDPFWNPNLSLDSGDFAIAATPRRIKPWRREATTPKPPLPCP